MSNKKLILITGVGRSGTSVLQSILHEHSQINFPPETHFFKRHIIPFLLKSKVPNFKDLSQDPYLKRLNEPLRRDIVESVLSDLNDLLDVFVRISEDAASNYLGDKDTEYVRYLPHLAKVFPKAIVVHIIRDPRDVVLSRTKTVWGKKHGLCYHAAEYQYYIKQLTILGPKLFKERYLELRYEDLIDQPERTLKRLLHVLSLKYEPGMLDFHQSKGSLVGTDEKAWKENLMKPLLIGNQGKWKSSLTFEQAALVEHGIKDFMKNHGYELTKHKPTFIGLIRKKIVMMLFAGKTYKERLR